MPEILKMETINPQIREAMIGKKNLRKVQIFPLSVGDQLKFNDFFAELIAVFATMDPNAPLTAAFFSIILEKIRQNIDTFCKIVFEEEGILNEITNEQAMAVAQVVYEVNYEGLAKNVQRLFKSPNVQKVLDGLGLERQPSQSADTTPGTISTSSSEGASTKAA